MTRPTATLIHRRLVDSLYTEAMLLADEARAYFDIVGRNDRQGLEALNRVAFSCESLKVTTRLMHIIAWLLTQRAVMAGELAARDALDPSRRLGDGPDTDDATIALLPDAAKILVVASIDLHRRVTRFDKLQASGRLVRSPVRSLHERLAMAF